MELRGPVVAVEEPRTVSTRNGSRDVAEVTMRPGRGEEPPVTVSLWGSWAETAESLVTGMTVLVTEPSQEEFRGETRYATTAESYVVIEPEFMVNVTDIREWVQCSRQYYLSKFTGASLSYPLVKGSLVHEVFGDLLRGRDLETSVEERVADAGLKLGLLDRDRTAVVEDVRSNAQAIERWLQQGTLTEDDEWRSELTLISETFGIKGRADAVRRGGPVELKTGKNTDAEPRFKDKVQATCYALLLGEHGQTPETGTLLYTKNAVLDRTEETGDLSPAKEFSISSGLLQFVVRARNELVAMEFDSSVPTGYESNAICEYCFEQDTCMVVSGRLDQESKAGAVGTALPAAEREYFDRLYRAAEAERREIHREYAKLWTQSAAERAADDKALLDLQPQERSQRANGTWELRAENDDTTAVSKIREGETVLASDGHPTRGDTELARVVRLRTSTDGTTEIVVHADEPIELRRLDVYPSDYGINGLLTAVHDSVLKGAQRRRDLLFGRRDPTFGETDATFIDNNAAQNRAVELAVTAEDCALIHGPPGTGKTYTLAQTVRALCERGERVLLSAFTNRAVDNALEQLREQGFTDFVRIGTEHGVSDSMQDARLDYRGDPEERAATLRNAPVVAGTAATCGSPVLKECAFDVAIVDEAGQLTEPDTLAAINLADRFVLVGDHEQLPPVVRDDDSALQTSLFERLIDRYPDAAVTLDKQYRMAQRIQYFSSQTFYDGQLRPASPAVAGQQLSELPTVSHEALPSALQDAVAFVDPDGTATGNVNRTEAERVAEIVDAYRSAGVPADDIGVIAPFRAQVAEITRRVSPDITVDTVDRFQGSDRSVIIVSFVATGTLDSPIFEDRRRVNVALTRAKKALCLVGDERALRSDPFYERMLEWAQS
ncbi:AAA domain-containing protein [Halocatena pleomorpha]|uniref:DNA helicase n=1 Tax=Halocatena pleomorpha TaxID=1785090 RepID=A0A3P3R5W3_9EURY|nr:AAA domain-containing protein [Halocatena pleomorpha]RRJ28279.1 AAA family ATPase [Halocatena pleomorpha]